MNKSTLIKISLLGIFFTLPVYANDVYFYGYNQPSSLGKAHIIFDNTAGLNNSAILSNMETNYSEECSKADVLEKSSCNGFALGNNDIQVVQNDLSGNLVSMIGVNNGDSTDDANMGKFNEANLFDGNNPLFKLQDYRDAADQLTKTVTGAPPGTYGTINFLKFLLNIAMGKTMYGIVRVKLPVFVAQPGNKNSTQLCGESPKYPGCKKLYSPWPYTVIRAGATVVGVKFPPGSEINIKGTLMFDWYNVDTGKPLQPEDFPDDPSQISIKIHMPLNINPVNIDPSTQTMASVKEIVQITGDNSCATGKVCSVPIESPIYFSSVPQESIDMYKYKMYKRSGKDVTLNSAKFDTLSRAEQYHLLFPSGYAKGWSSAFKALHIKNADWQALGFETPSATSITTADGIRSPEFEDMPALITNGGLLRINHHANISGLIYAGQALEIAQDGDYDYLAGKLPYPFTPTWQYFSGAIVVHEGFYFEAINQGGITLISNNPDTYSNTKLSNSNGVRMKFQAYSKNGGTGILSIEESGAQFSSENGPQWVEIRPM